RSNAPAGGERDCQFSGDAANCFEKSRAAIPRRRDVEYDQFVCTFRIVSAGERNGVAGISQTHKITPFTTRSPSVSRHGMMWCARLMPQASGNSGERERQSRRFFRDEIAPQEH